MLTDPTLSPPKTPSSDNTNRIKNLASSFKYILSRDDKYVAGHACVLEAIKLALGMKAKAENTRIQFGILPFDKDPSNAQNFYIEFVNHLGSHCKFHHHDRYLKSTFARALGYDTWQEMMFVLDCYNDLTHNNWICCNRKIRRPRVNGRDQDNPGTVILAGSSSTNYGNIIPSSHFKIFKRDGVWALYNPKDGLFTSMRRYWGITPWDAIAWYSAETLWCIGPKAWNRYISLSASDKVKEVMLWDLASAEDEAIEWRVARRKIISS